MSFSQGNIVLTNNNPPAPAIVTGANNGLHLNGSNVQMGGDLIQATEIGLNSNFWAINDEFGQPYLGVNPGGITLNPNPNAGNLFKIFLDPDEKLILGANDSENYSNRIFVDNQNGIIEFYGAVNSGDMGLPTFQVSSAGQFFMLGAEQMQIFGDDVSISLGDINQINNGFKFTLDDPDGFCQIRWGVPNNRIFLNLVPEYLSNAYEARFGDVTRENFRIQAGNFLMWDNTTSRYFNLDIANNNYEFGDIDGSGNNTYMTIDDSTQSHLFFAGGSNIGQVRADGFSTNGGANSWQFGGVTAGAASLDTANYLNATIDGVPIKIALIT